MNKGKPAGDELKQGNPTKTGQDRPKRSRKPAVVKAQVIEKHVAGQSNREIARELDIHRETVANIVEEADMDSVLVECGYTHKAIVENHLKPLLSATKSGMYGTDIAGATRLGALRLIDKWKGISAKTQAKIRARVENARIKNNGSSTNTICLVVADEARAARLAGLLSASGPAGVVIDVDASVDSQPG